ncbi:MAG TPA: XdhC family protein [Pyrinomonadaceae bacterium]|jgi:xanthine/CO dehydrogenase XdhC/CoxF family maturation factor
MSKELRDILERVSSLGPADQAVLATVVGLEGSGYRLPGARMLIDRNGAVIGTVSGGCLEADLLERAERVFATGEPAVVTYDTRGKDDSVFSLNMGCNGVLRVLLEPVDGNDLFGLIEKVFSTRQSITVATAIASNSPQHPIGERRILSPDSRDSDSQDFFVETIHPPFNLVVFGGGFDAVPVVRLAKEIGWVVTVVDHRIAYLDTERLSHPDQILELRPEQLAGSLKLGHETAAVVMTHNFERDREILSFLLTQPVQYIGALGPKKRTKQILSDLKKTGLSVNTTTLEKLHAPIGLDIGAHTPESIALSIIAEIQATITHRNAGFLKDRNAPIYDRDHDRPMKSTKGTGEHPETYFSVSSR